MTTKREDKRHKLKAHKRPKLKKETLKDLDAKGDAIKGGRPLMCTRQEQASCDTL